MSATVAIVVVVVVVVIILLVVGIIYLVRSRSVRREPPVGELEVSMDEEEGRARSPSVYSCLSWGGDENLVFASCGEQKLFDWGPGVRACARCGARPIFNRGCQVCDTRMCEACFDGHKKLTVTTVSLAHLVLKKYDTTHTSTLSLPEWNTLLTDLSMPQQSEEEFAVLCAARDVDPSHGITLDHLLVLTAFLAPNAFETLTRAIGMSAFTPAPGPRCAERVPHDWGPGLASCTNCRAFPILNRGCGVCMVKMCGNCFENHVKQQPSLPAPTLPPPPPDTTPLSPIIESQHQNSPERNAAISFTSGVADGMKIGNMKAKVVGGWDVLGERGNDVFLGEGGSYYYFTFLKGAAHPRGVLEMSAKVINLTAFEDETRDNNVPKIDPFDPLDQNEYFLLLNKAIYMIPNVTLEEITKDRVVSKDYQSRCQPSGVKIHDTPEQDTFRFTKPIIWPVYSLTMQFRVSVIPAELYKDLSELTDGLPVHFGLLLERTKRNKAAIDVIKKAKSVLLYHEVAGGEGVVVTNITTGAATSVPSIVATVVDKLGSMGAKDVADTAVRTRKYFAEEAKKKKIEK